MAKEREEPEDLEPRVRAFIEGWFGRALSTEAALDILHENHCDGDDAMDFMQAYSKEFSVDFEHYMWEFHHVDEMQLRSEAPDRKEMVVRQPITLPLLVKAAEIRAWPLRYKDQRPSAQWARRIGELVWWIAGGILAGVILLILI